MKTIFVVLLGFGIGCSTSSPNPKEPPGASSPGSPSSAWTTTGGPESPGVPAMGSLKIEDAGPDGSR
jgi:hypothetical protein